MGIPYHQFGSAGPLIHFGHANGYPPLAYRQLLENLSVAYRIMAMRMRPLWPDSQPAQLHNWQPLADDLDDFLRQERVTPLVGAGHSMGATTALRLALRSPQTFSALILIDPVLFVPRMIYIMRLMRSLGLSYQLHPLVGSALRRRRVFESKQIMFQNYRGKEIFRRMDDAALGDYVDALARSRPDGQFELEYPPEWEAQIYVTGILADMEIWRDLASLELPLLVVRGQDSGTFRPEAERLIRKKLPHALIENIPGGTHLVPLEQPTRVSEIMQEFLRTVQ